MPRASYLDSGGEGRPGHAVVIGRPHYLVQIGSHDFREENGSFRWGTGGRSPKGMLWHNSHRVIV